MESLRADGPQPRYLHRSLQRGTPLRFVAL